MFAARQKKPTVFRCHGLVPWSFMFAARQKKPTVFRCHGLAPWSFMFAANLAENVNLHGTRPWHPFSRLSLAV
jgi:hypothetical protein